MKRSGFAEHGRTLVRGARAQRTTSERRKARPVRKRAVNVSIDSEILEVAKEMRINISQVLEEELREQVREERLRRFQEEHRQAIESYNEFIAQHGIWSEKYRRW